MSLLQAPTRPERIRPAIVWMFLAGISFGIMGLSVRKLSPNVGFFLLVFLRSLINFIISCGVAKAMGNLRLPNHPRILIYRGLAGFTGLSLYFFALTQMPLSIASIIVQCAPIFVFFFSRILLGERGGKGHFFWMLSAMAGVVFLLSPEIFYVKPAHDLPPLAVLACIAAAATSGLAHSLVRAAAFQFTTQEVLLVFTGTSTLLSLPVLFFVTDVPEASSWGWILVLGVSSWVAQWAMTKALENAQATRVGTLALQNPVTASLMAVFFLGETLVPVQWLGMGIVLFSLLMFNLKRLNQPA